EFDSLLVNAIAFTEPLQREKVTEINARFYLGTAIGMRAFLHSDEGEWLAAIQKGFSAANYFREVIKEDSTFYDAYLGKGTFDYWKSKKTEFLHWLPFIYDDRAEGIRLLEVCAARSLYNRATAMRALIEIHLDAGNWPEAFRWIREGRTVFPDNRFFLWASGVANMKAGHSPEAAASFRLLLENILHSMMPNPYPEISARMNLAKALLSTRDTVGAEKELQTILRQHAFRFSLRTAQRANAKFEEAGALLRQISLEAKGSR
ncbi:MAG: hypothetical protein HY966_04210, partial [Ignavibacteriales bacterium]|nr:hypothetical protein [Ignavibacteriales bacterium]